jgi:hypothetical protein
MKIRWLLVPLCLVLLASPLLADVIHLKNGRTIEGVVLSDDGRVVRLKTSFGNVDVPHSDIARIEKKLTPIQEYEDRRGKLKPDDAEGHYQLALFCKKEKLRKQERELYALTLEIDDQHAGANQAVGNVEHEGTWMTPAMRDSRLSDASEAEMRARGLVKHGGEWVTPEDKEKLEQGLVKYEGRWMTPDEVQEAKGFVKYNGGWIRKEELERRKFEDHYGKIMKLDVKVAFTEHFMAVGPFEEAELTAICVGAEQVYVQFLQIFGLHPKTNLFKGSEEDSDRTRCHIVYSKLALHYTHVVDAFCERYPQDMPPSRANLMKQQKGFYFVYPSCYIVGFMFPNTFDQVRASVMHKTSHALVMRYKYASGFFPWWLIEGLGTYQEICAIGRCDTYCITERGYGAPEGDANQKWAGMNEWKQLVKSQVVGMGDKSLIALSRNGLNELDFRDLAKCWSLMEWLIAKRREKFVALVDKLKVKTDFRKAVEDVFGITAEQLDKEWRDYVRNTY